MEGQREATRKSLNLDLRKFKTEVANIIKHLNERVQKMFRLTEGRHSGTCMCPEVGRLVYPENASVTGLDQAESASLQSSLAEFAELKAKFDVNIKEV